MNEIEEQFFEAFEINKSTLCKYAIYKYNWYKCAKRCEECWTYPHESTCNDRETDYPKITAYILLKLICLMGNTDYFLITNEGLPINIEGLKDSVLHSLTIYSKFHKGLKEQVQEIFKEQ